MKTTINLLITVVSILFLLGCQSKEDTEGYKEDVFEYLVGTWDIYKNHKESGEIIFTEDLRFIQILSDGTKITGDIFESEEDDVLFFYSDDYEDIFYFVSLKIETKDLCELTNLYPFISETVILKRE